jgi:putative transcriptional regulator
MRWASLIGVMAAGLCLAGPTTFSSLQDTHYESGSVATGQLLVAGEKLQDPNFAESVILIVDSDPDQGTVGVVINRRSDVPLSKIFPRIKSAPNDPVFMGGPVGIGSGQALLRADTESAGRHIVDDIYVSGSKELIESTVAAKTSPAKFRLYLGYAGWAPGQLEAEIAAGAWLVRAGSAQIVFDTNPDSLWTRLIRESHMRIAEACRNRLGQSC